MSIDYTRVREKIEMALESGDWAPAEARADIAFHMTDWINDLQDWYAFCGNPDSLDDEAVGELVFRFLAHVPNHLAAAAKLIDVPVSDIFNVGALEGIDE